MYRTDGKIPTGFIVTGPRIATDAGLFDAIPEHAKLEEQVATIDIDSAQTPNLKSALKYINRYATMNAPDQADTNDRQQVSTQFHLKFSFLLLKG